MQQETPSSSVYRLLRAFLLTVVAEVKSEKERRQPENIALTVSGAIVLSAETKILFQAKLHPRHHHDGSTTVRCPTHWGNTKLTPQHNRVNRSHFASVQHQFLLLRQHEWIAKHVALTVCRSVHTSLVYFHLFVQLLCLPHFQISINTRQLCRSSRLVFYNPVYCK